MSKDPAVLFYTSDFLTGTSRLTDEQCGQYIRALCSQHQEGHFTKEELLHILKSYDNRVWEKFIKDENGNYYNERMDIEIKKRFEYCNSRSHKGLSGRKREEKTNHTNIIRIPNGNRIENDNSIIKKDFIKDKEVFKIPSIEDVKSYCIERKNAVDPQQFIDHYEARGWQFKTGQKMKSWQAAVRTWERNNFNKPQRKQYGRQEIDLVALKKRMEGLNLE